MKLKIYGVATIMLLLASLSSCQKDKLNPVSNTSISDANAFDNASRINLQVSGLYAAIKTGNFYASRYLIYNDVRGENFINETNNVVTARNVWDFTVPSSDTYLTGLWNAAYAAINKANIFMEGMQAKGNSVVGADLAKQYNGEAKLIRAVCYYALVQMYARPYWDGNGSKPGVPLRLKGITSAGSNNLARSSVAEVYAQIISDLDSAEANLPADYKDATKNVIRAQRNTAIALKTRVYLSMGNYAKVIEEANKMVPATAPFQTSAGVPAGLEANVKTVFTSYTSKEVIFTMPFVTGSDVPGGQSQLASYYMPASSPTGGAGEFSLNAKGIIAEKSWTDGDARRGFIYSGSNGKKWLAKWTTPTPYPDWIPVIRYAEVLLNLAEAKARVSGTVDAQSVALLNAIRNRSDAATTFTTGSFATSQDLLDAILLERNIEFLGEGIHAIDIQRLGLPFPAKGSVAAVDATNSAYIWQIPTSETAYNTLCVPN
ncbi:RagB/SusD family nutrient uptake outer membrane protein [Deminuibacter soli]|uniref:RagB/SusD family nutrient uptake outer membrane protein n=1 Tax=Deminuibacter soli TaxID=2291815 RepID=A0A3E1NPN1_9BACT|nr:RagB/SusD family nutrient uptake outer membrane protein [Deminuibacter soli]RFM29895.1 RagB/SusD family nutrient uptake outer membrane protein [Deminuibacter soli]